MLRNGDIFFCPCQCVLCLWIYSAPGIFSYHLFAALFVQQFYSHGTGLIKTWTEKDKSIDQRKMCAGYFTNSNALFAVWLQSKKKSVRELQIILFKKNQAIIWKKLCIQIIQFNYPFENWCVESSFNVVLFWIFLNKGIPVPRMTGFLTNNHQSCWVDAMNVLRVGLWKSRISGPCSCLILWYSPLNSRW